MYTVQSALNCPHYDWVPFSFITPDVIEAMCACLLATAEECVTLQQSSIVAEKQILKEFGRCLAQLRDVASSTDLDDEDCDASSDL